MSCSCKETRRQACADGVLAHWGDSDGGEAGRGVLHDDGTCEGRTLAEPFPDVSSLPSKAPAESESLRLVDFGARVSQVAPDSAGFGKVNAGDVLVGVAGTDTCIVDFDQTMAAVKQAQRPLTLTFVSPPALPTPQSSNGSDIFSIYPIEVS